MTAGSPHTTNDDDTTIPTTLESNIASTRDNTVTPEPYAVTAGSSGITNDDDDGDDDTTTPESYVANPGSLGSTSDNTINPEPYAVTAGSSGITDGDDTATPESHVATTWSAGSTRENTLTPEEYAVTAGSSGITDGDDTITPNSYVTTPGSPRKENDNIINLAYAVTVGSSAITDDDDTTTPGSYVKTPWSSGNTRENTVTPEAYAVTAGSSGITDDDDTTTPNSHVATPVSSGSTSDNIINPEPYAVTAGSSGITDGDDTTTPESYVKTPWSSGNTRQNTVTPEGYAVTAGSSGITDGDTTTPNSHVATPVSSGSTSDNTINPEPYAVTAGSSGITDGDDTTTPESYVKTPWSSGNTRENTVTPEAYAVTAGSSGITDGDDTTTPDSHVATPVSSGSTSDNTINPEPYAVTAGSSGITDDDDTTTPESYVKTPWYSGNTRENTVTPEGYAVTAGSSGITDGDDTTTPNSHVATPVSSGSTSDNTINPEPYAVTAGSSGITDGDDTATPESYVATTWSAGSTRENTLTPEEYAVTAGSSGITDGDDTTTPNSYVTTPVSSRSKNDNTINPEAYAVTVGSSAVTDGYDTTAPESYVKTPWSSGSTRENTLTPEAYAVTAGSSGITDGDDTTTPNSYDTTPGSSRSKNDNIINPEAYTVTVGSSAITDGDDTTTPESYVKTPWSSGSTRENTVTPEAYAVTAGSSGITDGDDTTTPNSHVATPVSSGSTSDNTINPEPYAVTAGSSAITDGDDTTTPGSYTATPWSSGGARENTVTPEGYAVTAGSSGITDGDDTTTPKPYVAIPGPSGSTSDNTINLEPYAVTAGSPGIKNDDDTTTPKSYVATLKSSKSSSDITVTSEPYAVTAGPSGISNADTPAPGSFRITRENTLIPEPYLTTLAQTAITSDVTTSPKSYGETHVSTETSGGTTILESQATIPGSPKITSNKATSSEPFAATTRSLDRTIDNGSASGSTHVSTPSPLGPSTTATQRPIIRFSERSTAIISSHPDITIKPSRLNANNSMHSYNNGSHDTNRHYTTTSVANGFGENNDRSILTQNLAASEGSQSTISGSSELHTEVESVVLPDTSTNSSAISGNDSTHSHDSLSLDNSSSWTMTPMTNDFHGNINNILSPQNQTTRNTNPLASTTESQLWHSTPKTDASFNSVSTVDTDLQTNKIDTSIESSKTETILNFTYGANHTLSPSQAEKTFNTNEIGHAQTEMSGIITNSTARPFLAVTSEKTNDTVTSHISDNGTYITRHFNVTSTLVTSANNDSLLYQDSTNTSQAATTSLYSTQAINLDGGGGDGNAPLRDTGDTGITSESVTRPFDQPTTDSGDPRTQNTSYHDFSNANKSIGSVITTTSSPSTGNHTINNDTSNAAITNVYGDSERAAETEQNGSSSANNDDMFGSNNSYNTAIHTTNNNNNNYSLDITTRPSHDDNSSENNINDINIANIPATAGNSTLHAINTDDEITQGPHYSERHLNNTNLSDIQTVSMARVSDTKGNTITKPYDNFMNGTNEATSQKVEMTTATNYHITHTRQNISNVVATSDYIKHDNSSPTSIPVTHNDSTHMMGNTNFDATALTETTFPIRKTIDMDFTSTNSNSTDSKTIQIGNDTTTEHSPLTLPTNFYSTDNSATNTSQNLGAQHDFNASNIHGGATLDRQTNNTVSTELGGGENQTLSSGTRPITFATDPSVSVVWDDTIRPTNSSSDMSMMKGDGTTSLHEADNNGPSDPPITKIHNSDDRNTAQQSTTQTLINLNASLISNFTDNATNSTPNFTASNIFHGTSSSENTDQHTSVGELSTKEYYTSENPQISDIPTMPTANIRYHNTPNIDKSTSSVNSPTGRMHSETTKAFVALGTSDNIDPRSSDAVMPTINDNAQTTTDFSQEDSSLQTVVSGTNVKSSQSPDSISSTVTAETLTSTLPHEATLANGTSEGHDSLSGVSPHSTESPIIATAADNINSTSTISLGHPIPTESEPMPALTSAPPYSSFASETPSTDVKIPLQNDGTTESLIHSSSSEIPIGQPGIGSTTTLVSDKVTYASVHYEATLPNSVSDGPSLFNDATAHNTEFSMDTITANNRQLTETSGVSTKYPISTESEPAHTLTYNLQSSVSTETLSQDVNSSASNQDAPSSPNVALPVGQTAVSLDSTIQPSLPTSIETPINQLGVITLSTQTSHDTHGTTAVASIHSTSNPTVTDQKTTKKVSPLEVGDKLNATLMRASPNRQCDSFGNIGAQSPLGIDQFVSDLWDENNDTCFACFAGKQRYLQVTFNMTGTSKYIRVYIIGLRFSCNEPYLLVYQQNVDDFSKCSAGLHSLQCRSAHQSDTLNGKHLCGFICVIMKPSDSVYITLELQYLRWKASGNVNAEICEVMFYNSL